MQAKNRIKNLFTFILVSTIFPLNALAGISVKAGIYQNEPKIFLDNQSKPAGFFVDLINTIAQSENWKIEYIPCEWVECLRQLENGELDLMADVAFSAERKKRFDFGREVVFSSWSVVYAKPQSGINSVPDLNNKKVVVLRDSVQAKALKELTKNFGISPQFIEVASFQQGYDLVESDQADSIAVNRFYGKRHESKYSVRPTSILVAPSLVNFAASKKDERLLLDAIDQNLIKLKKDTESVFYQAFDRWFEANKITRLPSWFTWVMISIGLVITGLVILTFIFRRLVKHKTYELEKNKDYLERLSYLDSLTGLPNRVLFLDRLEQAALKERQNQDSLAILFIDLDRFKEINDSFGHETGDSVLKMVAERFTLCIRKEDTIARLGGDEFTILLKSLKRPEIEATAVAEQILGSLTDAFQFKTHYFYVTASVGISLSKQDGNNASDLLRNADAAMYKAKQEVGNTFNFYTEEMTRHAIERISLTTALREAVDNNEFFLYYQPLFNLKNLKVVGVEALVRWKKGSKEMVSPAKFIPLAEDSGVIFSIGEFVLRQACLQMVEWKREGIAPGRIAVNLSGKQLQRGDIVDVIKDILQQTSCQADWLELEVTEGFIMNAPDISIPLLKKLRDMGLELAIDDFGTGYSSLAYLKKLPISKLKIDQSFVRDITIDQNDMEIARAVIALGKSLNLTVLAEGIEREEQLDLLKLEGCNHGQGFLISKPLPAEQITYFLRNNTAESGK